MADPSQDERIEQLKKDLDEWKTRASLDSARLTQEATSLKTQLDALKDEKVAQFALNSTLAQQSFAELQGIKAGLAGLTLPTGKEGTVKVAAGVAGTALLRSKVPMFELLDEVANDLVQICPTGAVVLTEDQLSEAHLARFTIHQIDLRIQGLTNAIARFDHTHKSVLGLTVPGVIATAYTLGFAIDTIHSLGKLLRTDRQLDVFDANAEASQVLGYLLEIKSTKFLVNPTQTTDDEIHTLANDFASKLGKLGAKIGEANELLDRLKALSVAVMKNQATDPDWQSRLPDSTDQGLLEAELDAASSVLDGLHPTKSPDHFWAEVNGQLIARRITDRHRLLLDIKGQAIQTTRSSWFWGDSIQTTGEVQVLYRCYDHNGTLQKSGIVMKSSRSQKCHLDERKTWQWPSTSLTS